MKGMSVEQKHFNQICDELDKVGIAHEVWNISQFMNPSYDGPIELDCLNNARFDEFNAIVKKVQNNSA